MVEKRIANSDGRTDELTVCDGLTDWLTDGRRIQYLTEYVFLKIRGKCFQKIRQIIFEKMP